MDIASIESDACKTIRSLGFSKERTHMIINGLSKSLRSNGPEWTISRLNSLRDYYVDPSSSEFPGWIAKTRRSDGILRPKGWLGSISGAHTDLRTCVTLYSTVSKSITFGSPTLKQLSKWKDAVIDPPVPHDAELSLNIDLGALEKRLVEKTVSRPFFGPDDVKGSRIPVGYETFSIKHKEGYPDLGDLHRAWEHSLLNAPVASWYFQEQSGVNIPSVSKQRGRVLINKFVKTAPDSKHRLKLEKSGRLVKKAGRVSEVQRVPIGSISFLQQPGGKLRTVANPNRFVQWQLEPLGEVLSDWVNSQPDVYVLNQEAGIQWIQRQLSFGKHMTSADLSSASDTLDYKQVTKLLKSGDHPALTRAVEYFERCSGAPWAVSDWDARSFLGSDDLVWKQGQPLGLRPSFPILTMTNLLAARKAVELVDGKYTGRVKLFAIVGDDIVIPTKYAEAYSSVISSLGGVANIEKSMSSDKRAEFCSRIIEADTVYRLKPRYILDNDPQNILTYQDTSVRPVVKGWIRNMSKRVGSYHLVESGLVPNFHASSPKPLPEKLLADAVLSLSEGKTPDLKTVTFMTSYLSGRVPRDPSHVLRRARPGGPRKGYSKLTTQEKINAFKAKNPSLDIVQVEGLLDYSGKPSWRDTPQARHFGIMLDQLAADPRLRAKVPQLKWYRTAVQSDPAIDAVVGDVAREQHVGPKTEYDYHTDSRVQPVKAATSLSAIDRKLSNVERDTVKDSSSAHLVRKVSEDVDMLVEDTGDGFSVSYHGKTQDSAVTHVEKRVSTTETPSGISDDGTPLVKKRSVSFPPSPSGGVRKKSKDYCPDF